MTSRRQRRDAKHAPATSDGAAAAAANRSWADGRAAPALVAAVTALVFLRSLSGGFVWDDHFFLDSPFIQSPGSWMRVVTDAGAADPFGFVRPLRTIEFALDYALGHGGAALFHVHSLLWHVAGSVLFLFVLRRLLGDGRAALAAALFWALHPVQVESVAWIACRGDVATGACSMAAVLFALRSEGLDRSLAISVAAAAASLLYKEAAITLSIVIATLRWLKLTRVPVWPYVVVAAVFLVYRQSVHTAPLRHVESFVLGGSFVGTVATMIRAFGFYIAQALLPAQSVDWHMTPSTGLADAAVIAWLAVHAALVVSAIAARTRAPLWTLAVAWFYVFLVPVANWPVFLGIPTAERYLYLSLAGVAIAVGLAARHAPRRAGPAIVVLLAALGAASFARTAMWKSDESLWDTVLADHESPRCHAFLGEHERDEAVAMRQEAAAMPAGPARDEAVERSRKLLADAIDHLHTATDEWRRFEMVERAQGQFARRAEINLANVAYLLGRKEEALFHAEEALAIDGPPLPEPSYTRALALLDLGFPVQAMTAMRQARADGFGGVNPEIAGFFLDAARACATDSLDGAAEEGYATALEAAPEGTLREEIASAREELRRKPRSPGSDVRERARIAQLDASLASLSRSCPARRPVSRAK